MPSNPQKPNVTFLSTYPPRECGIASFTEDLLTAIDKYHVLTTNVIAINNVNSHDYSDKVIHQLNQEELGDYKLTSEWLNESSTDVLAVEHEYGIFGGDRGEYLIDLIERTNVPVITTLHTVLPNPDEKQKKIITEIGKKSEKIVTMANNTKEILQTVFNVDKDKIQVIHHGVPKRPLKSRDSLKRKYGFSNKEIVTTFGLIGPGKGIENGIEAMSRVAEQNKNVLYLILGATHPALKERGIEYRKKLEDQVENLNLKGNIIFINKFLTKDEVIEYLQMTDIYLTPYLGKDQAVSGTMAYAVGYGKAIVSTPYLYAREMLSDGKGILTDFNDPNAMAENLLLILNDKNIKNKLEKAAKKLGATMYWDMVAREYIELFTNMR